MMFRKIQLCLLFLGLGLLDLQAQETVNSSGGIASGIGGTESYSIGQVFYIQNIGNDETESQGVQQPFEISVTSGFNEEEDVVLSLTAYPNPTRDFLLLRVNNLEFTNLLYQLYDVEGKLIYSQKVESNNTNIDMRGLASSMYLIKVFQGNKEIKSFKIIKN